MSFPEYDTKSDAQLRRERREGLLLVVALYVFIFSARPVLRFIETLIGGGT